MSVLQRTSRSLVEAEVRTSRRTIPTSSRRSTTIIVRRDHTATTLPMWTSTRTRPTRPRSTRSSTATRRTRAAQTNRASATSACDRSTPAAALHHSTDHMRAARESREPKTDSRGRTLRCRWPRWGSQTGKVRQLEGGHCCCFWLLHAETLTSCLCGNCY